MHYQAPYKKVSFRNMFFKERKRKGRLHLMVVQ